MIPIKNFKKKMPYLAKTAESLSKQATLIKNFKMPFIKVLSDKSNKRKKKK
jgi:hypothetical protein